MRYDIPCAHEDGLSTDVRIPDYYPLSRDEVLALVLAAYTDNAAKTSIQCRLVQGIRGIECPRRATGPVSDVECRLNDFYVHRFEDYRDNPSAFADELFKILAEAG